MSTEVERSLYSEKALHPSGCEKKVHCGVSNFVPENQRIRLKMFMFSYNGKFSLFVTKTCMCQCVCHLLLELGRNEL